MQGLLVYDRLELIDLEEVRVDVTKIRPRHGFRVTR